MAGVSVKPPPSWLSKPELAGEVDLGWDLISCSVLVSNSGAVPLLDVRLVVEYLKKADSPATSGLEKQDAGGLTDTPAIDVIKQS